MFLKLHCKVAGKIYGNDKNNTNTTTDNKNKKQLHLHMKENTSEESQNFSKILTLKQSSKQMTLFRNDSILNFQSLKMIIHKLKYLDCDKVYNGQISKNFTIR
jgi:hypothetical protein